MYLYNYTITYVKLPTLILSFYDFSTYIFLSFLLMSDLINFVQFRDMVQPRTSSYIRAATQSDNLLGLPLYLVH